MGNFQDYDSNLPLNNPYSLVRKAVDAAGYNLTEQHTYTYTVYKGGAWYGIAIVSAVLLNIAGLLAGLILAICGLNMRLLQMRAVTGTPKQRQQALVVARMKIHGTWMLCALIICSVACSESLPSINQSLNVSNSPWMPILVSTLSVAIFGELLPQYTIPRNAIAWGYYCWPIIWGCMWLTAIVSWPLSKLLDHICGSNDQLSIFSNGELAVLIKYHERSEKQGGQVGQDANRLMLGALKLDGSKVGGELTRLDGEKDIENDAEKSEGSTHGMIVKWSAVRTVDIDEPVDKDFIIKVLRWSYSRIPVIGKHQEDSEAPWNLIGLDIGKSNAKMSVRDLVIYPLPIIREDMTAYDLLNLFQLGMSRMAVVIPVPPTIVGNAKVNPIDMPAVWTATEKTNSRNMAQFRTQGYQVDWTTDFLDAAKSITELPVNRKHSIIGIRSPEPSGIITLEDILDTLFQKTSRDEKDFFDRDTTKPPTKTRKAGDYPSMMNPHVISDHNAPKFGRIPQGPFQISTHGTLRKRNISYNGKTVRTMDGVDERSIEDDSHDQTRHDCETSSYTQNSRGGFHGSNESETPSITCELRQESVSSSEDDSNPPAETASLPSRKSRTSIFPEVSNPSCRHASATAAPNLPKLRRVTPFSRQNYSSFERMFSQEQEKSGSIIPAPPISSPDSNGFRQAPFDGNTSGIDGSEIIDATTLQAPSLTQKKSGKAVSLNPCYYNDDTTEGIEESNFRLYKASPLDGSVSQKNILGVEPPSAQPYEGFPLELLDLNDKENHAQYPSQSLPRMTALGEATATPFFIYRLRDAMLADATGRRILRDRPRISSKTMSLTYLRSLPENTVGRNYATWLDREGVSPDTRDAVKYIDDEECAYVMQRYRESHDFYHALTGLPVFFEGEVALKAFEFANTLLPMTGLSAIASLKMKPAEKKRFVEVFLPWAVGNGLRAKEVINVYWEEELERDVESLRRELGMEKPVDLRDIRKKERERKKAEREAKKRSKDSLGIN
ncbi:hypothetical protein B7494_g6184 [Chlorociboria aeruginascens]|nr:hypothetical protein B7494_g6184 [Chlorociboria aeruginascens]